MLAGVTPPGQGPLPRLILPGRVAFRQHCGQHVLSVDGLELLIGSSAPTASPDEKPVVAGGRSYLFLALSRDGHDVGLGEFQQPLAAELPPDAALAESAERRALIHRGGV